MHACIQLRCCGVNCERERNSCKQPFLRNNFLSLYFPSLHMAVTVRLHYTRGKKKKIHKAKLKILDWKCAQNNHVDFGTAEIPIVVRSLKSEVDLTVQGLF